MAEARTAKGENNGTDGGVDKGGENGSVDDSSGNKAWSRQGRR